MNKNFTKETPGFEPGTSRTQAWNAAQWPIFKQFYYWFLATKNENWNLNNFNGGGAQEHLKKSVNCPVLYWYGEDISLMSQFYFEVSRLNYYNFSPKALLIWKSARPWIMHLSMPRPKIRSRFWEIINWQRSTAFLLLILINNFRFSGKF